MITQVFAGIPVDDFPTARAWYEILLGRKPDLVPRDDEAAWQLTETGWIYVVADAQRAGSALATFLVDDLERQIGFFALRGIAPETIDTIPGVVRKATVVDPAGNRLTFGQPLEPQPG